MSQEIQEKEFDTAVLNDPTPVLVDYFATWCPPCKQLTPVLEKVGTEFSGRLKIVKVNVDDNPHLAQRYSITGVPTMILYKNGSVEKVIVGFRAFNDLKRELEASL